MRILFFNYEFPPLGGGASTFNDYLFREFAKDPSVVIDCITSSDDHCDKIESFSENITLYRINVRKKNIHFWTQTEVMRYLLGAGKIVSDLLCRNRYDLSHGFAGFPSGFLSWRYRSRMPYLLSLLGSDVPGFNPRLSFQYAVMAPLFRRIWRQATMVVANSIGLRRLALEFQSDQEISIIPGGIDVEQFTPGPPEGKIPGRILCVSRLVERKGIRHLIDAMPQVVGRVPGASLTIAGTGNLDSALRRQAKESGVEHCIDFLGYVPHDQVSDLFAQAQLFAQPSYYEGMSNTVLEAMASALPIVASGEGGREELFRGNALHVPYGDPEALGQALSNLLSNPEALTRMGEKSREISLDYSYPRIAAQYLDAYRRVAASR